MKVYVHIGFPKTGSSAIQSHVFANEGWLKNKGVYLPHAGYASGLGHAFVLGNLNPLYSNEGEKDLSKAKHQLQNLVTELEIAEAQGFERALLTWEGFALISEIAIQELQKALNNHEVVLLAYVRDQLALYQSASMQGLEDLRGVPAARYFEQGQLQPQLLESIDFSKVLTTWSNVFGERLDIQTRIYVRDRLISGDVVKDFLNWIDLEPDSRFALDDRQVNPSIDSRAAALLLVAQALGVNYGTMTHLSRVLSRLASQSGGGTKEFLAEDEKSYIAERFQESNRRFFEQFRPGNTEGEEVEFPVHGQAGAKPTPERNPEFEYLRQVHAALTDAKLDIWEGGPLHGKKIARLTRPPSSGWRPPKKEGIWSAGPRSEIGFLLPKTDDEIGPHAIKLIVGGEYFGNNVTTQVRIGDYECRKDLTRAEIVIPLDENKRKKSIHIVLEHDKPLPPGNPDAEVNEHGIAFYLQFISYAFLWE